MKYNKREKQIRWLIYDTRGVNKFSRWEDKKNKKIFWKLETGYINFFFSQ